MAGVLLYLSNVHDWYALWELLFPVALMDFDKAELVIDLRNNAIAALRLHGCTRVLRLLCDPDRAGVHMPFSNRRRTSQLYTSQLLSAG